MQAAERSEDPADLFLRLEQLNDIGVALSRRNRHQPAAGDDSRRREEHHERRWRHAVPRDRGAHAQVRDHAQRHAGHRDGRHHRRRRPVSSHRALRSKGAPVTSMVAAYAVHHDRSINIADAYTRGRFRFHRDQELRRRTRAIGRASFLTIPMKDHENVDHRRAATAQRQGPGDGRRPRVHGRRPAPCGIAGVASGDRAHQPPADQSSRAAVRVVHRAHQCRDRRQVAVHERTLRARADPDDAAGGRRRTTARSVRSRTSRCPKRIATSSRSRAFSTTAARSPRPSTWSTRRRSCRRCSTASSSIDTRFEVVKRDAGARALPGAARCRAGRRRRVAGRDRAQMRGAPRRNRRGPRVSSPLQHRRRIDAPGRPGAGAADCGSLPLARCRRRRQPPS